MCGGMKHRKHFFHYRDPNARLPVLVGGQDKLVRWGSKTPEGVPQTGWARVESVLAGKWTAYQPRLIPIAAEGARERAVWFKTLGGLWGLVTTTPLVRAYVITTAATPAFRAVTAHDRMPFPAGALVLPDGTCIRIEDLDTSVLQRLNRIPLYTA